MSYQRAQHTKPINSTKQYAAGFADFAAYIASDAELAIYRRFNRLSARNLLYLQSELLELERAVDAFDEEDLREQQGPDIDEARISRRWEEFVELSGNREKEGERMKVIKEVRRVMKEYHIALLLQSQALRLEDPDSRPLKAIKTFFSKNRPLLGNGHHLLDEADDLAALRPARGRDRVSRFLQDYCGWLFAENIDTPSSWRPIHYFPEHRISLIVGITSVLMSAILLVGAITSLFYIRAPGVKLGLIAVFTTLFAASVASLTNAKRAEVFATAAAYAAVLVVFVSGNFGQNSKSPG